MLKNCPLDGLFGNVEETFRGLASFESILATANILEANLGKSKIYGLCAVILVMNGLHSSCVSSGQKQLESQWADLEKVDDISCSTWPVRESELDISAMTANAGEPGGFIADVRLRNGGRLPVFADTSEGPSINKEKMTAIPIGRQAHVVGLVDWNKEPTAFVVQNKNNRAWIEARAVKDNRLVARMATPLPEEAESGRVVSVSNGWWLQLNHSEVDSSFVRVAPRQDGQWSFVVSTFQAHTRFASLVSNLLNQNAYVVENQNKPDENTSDFLMTKLDTDGKSLVLGRKTLPTKGGLESWSVALLGQKIVMAVIHGDSMVGQSSLLLAAVDIAGMDLQDAWHQEFALSDVHVAEPVWISNGIYGFVGIVKWIDAEGTLSRFKVDSTGAKQLPDVGVFEKGTILAAGYLNGSNNGLGAFRYRDKDLWKYKLCKLSF